jgi:catechol 2,3-dioxygenase-like lactoylglutathione lyase family enzyme
VSARVCRIAAFGLTSRDAMQLGVFYKTAFDCRLLRTDRLEGAAFETLMGVSGGAHRITLGLGAQTLEILQFDTPGQPYPEALSPMDNRFQHCALVVTDMDAAWRRLERLRGWTAMSQGGPQRLPPNTGSVKAFKFRDPEGHPLELLEFPETGRPAYWTPRAGELFLGIDHSALSVRDVEASVDFYESLGLHVAARTLNHGPEQQRLDGIDDPQVDVIALEPSLGTPHVELLHYRSSEAPRPVTIQSNDVAATRSIMETSDRSTLGTLLRDPDGHLVQLFGGDP